MAKNMEMQQQVQLSEDEEAERKLAAIRTALWVLAVSLVLPVAQYLLQLQVQ